MWRNIKYISLVFLVAQNTAVVLTMHYSRLVTGDGGKIYLVSTAVVLTELMKFVISMSMIFYISNFDVQKTGKLLYLEIIVKGHETVKLSVPSVLYTIQNNLVYVALSHLDAATFQVTYQLKILITALFSVVLLRKSLTKLQWFSLCVLMVAVALVQWSPGKDDSLYTGKDDGTFSSPLVGLVAILLACISSGFTGVYLEKILKSSDTSMWIRNIQMSILSFFVGMFGVFVTDRKAVLTGGFFQGYNLVVLSVITLQALGGIIVSVVMKYADNILKGFATSLSIILSSVISFFFLSDFQPTWNFIVGTVLVVVATYMYSRPAPKMVLPISEKQPDSVIR